MNTLLNRTEQAVSFIGTVCSITLFILMVMQVILRYLFSFTPVFTEEFARITLVWSVLAGTSLGIRHQSHIKVEFLLGLLPDKAKRVWKLILEIICLLFFIITTIKGIELVSFSHSQRSSGLQIPLSYQYISVPLFFGVGSIFFLERMLKAKRNKPEDTEQ